MTPPSGAQSIESIRIDQLIDACSILKIGWLPIDRHRFRSLEMEPGRSFIEHSSNNMLSAWRHQRTLTQQDDGVLVTDQCSLTPRILIFGPMLFAIYRLVFSRRHKRLLNLFRSER